MNGTTRRISFPKNKDMLQQWAVAFVKKECEKKGLKLIRGSVSVYVNPHDGHVYLISYRTHTK